MPKYATETDLVTGDGSKLHGARWNPKGIAVVYAADSPETAMAESLAQYRYYGIPIFDAMPRTFDTVRVMNQRLFGIRSASRNHGR